MMLLKRPDRSACCCFRCLPRLLPIAVAVLFLAAAACQAVAQNRSPEAGDVAKAKAAAATGSKNAVPGSRDQQPEEKSAKPPAKETPPSSQAALPEPAEPAAVINAGDFPTLQAALDALPAGGGVVRIPPGTYLLKEPLVLSRSNVLLAGSGPATRLVNCNTEGKPALVIRPAEIEKNPRARLWRVELAGFRIQGDPNAVDAKSTEPASGDGIFAQGVNELFIHGVSVDHNGGDGIRLVDCYEDPRIADCIITYNRGAGLYLQACHDIVVNANQFEENQRAVYCTDSFNLCMNGNNLNDHLDDGVVIENTYGSVLSGNMIEECQGTAIVLDRDCYGITLSANVLADNFGGGVELRDAWGCAVSANTFTIDAVRALVVGPASGRITITGNNFSDSFIGQKTRREGKPNLATGITLNGTQDIVISGNVFTGLADRAVTASGDCRRLVITGNLVLDVARNLDQPRKAFELGDASEVVLADNITRPTLSEQHKEQQ